MFLPRVLSQVGSFSKTFVTVAAAVRFLVAMGENVVDGVRTVLGEVATLTANVDPHTWRLQRLTLPDVNCCTPPENDWLMEGTKKKHIHQRWR